MSIESDIQKPNVGKLWEGFELDLNPIGVADVLYFSNGVNELGNDVVWQGNTYTRFPIEAEGFEKTGTGTQPRPIIRVANVDGIIGALSRENADLVRAKVTRRRTLVKYLDAVNFPGGVNDTADPNAGFDDEVWFIDRKVREDKRVVEWELVSAFDLEGLLLPRRQCIQNVCTWRYRSANCGYAGGPVADRNDQPVTDLAEDDCGKRLTSCRLRFPNQPLPFGGFPSVGLIR